MNKERLKESLRRRENTILRSARNRAAPELEAKRKAKLAKSQAHINEILREEGIRRSPNHSAGWRPATEDELADLKKRGVL